MGICWCVLLLFFLSWAIGLLYLMWSIVNSCCIAESGAIWGCQMNSEDDQLDSFALLASEVFSACPWSEKWLVSLKAWKNPFVWGNMSAVSCGLSFVFIEWSDAVSASEHGAVVVLTQRPWLRGRGLDVIRPGGITLIKTSSTKGTWMAAALLVRSSHRCCCLFFVVVVFFGKLGMSLSEGGTTSWPTEFDELYQTDNQQPRIRIFFLLLY